MKLDYSDSEFDMVVTSNASVYLEEAVRVLKPGGIILVAYSFGGEAFNKAKEEVNDLLNNNRLELELLKTSDKWVFILGSQGDVLGPVKNGSFFPANISAF